MIPDNGRKWHKTRFWRRLRADPDIKEKQLKRSPTLPYQNLTINAYFRMINGNHGCSYNIGMWNCRKGLVDGENQATYKMVEVSTTLMLSARRKRSLDFCTITNVL